MLHKIPHIINSDLPYYIFSIHKQYRKYPHYHSNASQIQTGTGLK